jgi:hypothetical protein
VSVACERNISKVFKQITGSDGGRQPRKIITSRRTMEGGKRRVCVPSTKCFMCSHTTENLRTCFDSEQKNERIKCARLCQFRRVHVPAQRVAGMGQQPSAKCCMGVQGDKTPSAQAKSRKTTYVRTCFWLSPIDRLERGFPALWHLRGWPAVILLSSFLRASRQAPELRSASGSAGRWAHSQSQIQGSVAGNERREVRQWWRYARGGFADASSIYTISRKLRSLLAFGHRDFAFLRRVICRD